MVQLHVGEEMQFSTIKRGTSNPGGRFIYVHVYPICVLYNICCVLMHVGNYY